MKTIFVPTDLSEQSYHSLDYALHLAKKVMAKKLVFFHLNPPVYNAEIPILYSDDLDRAHKEIKEHLQKNLTQAMERAGLNPESILTEVIVAQESGPVSAIVSYAKKAHANIIVMGTHGQTGIAKLVFGSVTAGVIEESDIPVLAVPKNYKFKDIKKLSFATSLDHFKSELHSILPFSNNLDASVESVHLNYGLTSEEKIESAKKLIARHYPQVNLQIPNAVPEEMLIEQLTEYMHHSKPEWLVMFPHKMAWYEKIFMTSKTLDLLPKLEFPMLAIRKWEKE